METKDIVSNVLNDSNVEAQVTELINAGKDVIVDMKSDGTAAISEVAKAKKLSGFGPVALVGGIGIAIGVGGTLIVQTIIRKASEAKDKEAIDAAFAAKAEAEAKEAGNDNVDNVVDAEETTGSNN